jgi:hypothetical protein
MPGASQEIEIYFKSRSFPSEVIPHSVGLSGVGIRAWVGRKVFQAIVEQIAITLQRKQYAWASRL